MMRKRTPTVKLVVSHWGGDPAERLHKLIRQCSEPTFDRRSNVVGLEVADRIITRQMVYKMVQLLNLPVANDSGSGTGDTDEDEDLRWICIQMNNCTIALRRITERASFLHRG